MYSSFVARIIALTACLMDKNVIGKCVKCKAINMLNLERDSLLELRCALSCVPVIIVARALVTMLPFIF